MPTIQAWQHIYSNVEKEQSPRRQGGFQTLFYTRAGLTEAEVEEMESRLLYFPSKVEPVKRLFFTTANGKGVVAQIVVLPDPDQAGRKGRYLAHSLVFTPEALAQFEANPFHVFRRFAFISTVAEALAQGDFQTGNIPAVSLTLPLAATPEVEAARLWSSPELKKLALLALRAEQQARQREALTFTGEPAHIERALEAALLAVPTSLRPRCIFDTYFYRCNLVATYFWAVGLPEPPVSIKFVLVEGGSHQVQGAAPDQAETSYERWVIATLENQKLAELARYRDQAHALGEWLDGRPSDLALLEAASPELIVDLFKVNPASVQAFLRRQIGEQLPSALVQRAANHLYQQTTELTLYQQLRQGLALPPLVAALYESYAVQNFEAPPREEIKALEKLLEQADHLSLRLFTVYWAKSSKGLRRELAQIDEPGYRQFSETALRLNLIEPLELLLPGRGDLFLDLYLATNVEHVTELAKALIEAKETACLARLAGYVPTLPGQELKRLAKLIADQPDVPKPFQLEVKRALAALPEAGGIRGLLRAVWRRLPGKE